MSNRTLLEINHDCVDALGSAFLHDLCSYLRSLDRDYAASLGQFGVRVITTRHHSEDYHIPPKTEGFSS